MTVVLFGGETFGQRLVAIAPSNLVVYYPLNETGGTTAFDASGNVRNGVYQNSPVLASITTPMGGKCVEFNTPGQRMNFWSAGMEAAWSPLEGTLFGWIYPTVSDASTRCALSLRIATGDRRYSLRKTASAVRGCTRGVESVFGSTYTVNQGYFAAMTWTNSGNVLSHYVNGVANGTPSTAPSYTGALSSGWCVVGDLNDTSSQPWRGGVAHFALWNVALTSAQVAAISST